MFDAAENRRKEETFSLGVVMVAIEQEQPVPFMTLIVTLTVSAVNVAEVILSTMNRFLLSEKLVRLF